VNISGFTYTLHSSSLLEDLKMKKLTLMALFCGLVLFGAQVVADGFGEAEVFSSQMRLSKDGTGLIKVINCYKNDCKKTLVTITQSTIGVLDGVEMGVLQAKKLSRPGIVALVYSAKTKEAVRIGFPSK
jgi:hypothetical protein